MLLLMLLLLLLQSRAFSLSAMLQPDNGPSMIIRAACDGGDGDGGDHVLERERERQEDRVLRAAVCMDRDVKPRSHHNN